MTSAALHCCSCARRRRRNGVPLNSPFKFRELFCCLLVCELCVCPQDTKGQTSVLPWTQWAALRRAQSTEQWPTLRIVNKPERRLRVPSAREFVVGFNVCSGGSLPHWQNHCCLRKGLGWTLWTTRRRTIDARQETKNILAYSVVRLLHSRQVFHKQMAKGSFKTDSRSEQGPFAWTVHTWAACLSITSAGRNTKPITKFPGTLKNVHSWHGCWMFHQLATPLTILQFSALSSRKLTTFLVAGAEFWHAVNVCR